MKKFLLSIVLLLINPALSLAADPVLFFSDFVQGPNTGWETSATKGAAITVWGLNLGTSGTVNCGGQHLSSSDRDKVAEWAATANPPTARGLQRITFWLNSSMSLGATTISVTVGEVTSNTLTFTVKQATASNHRIFFVNTGDGSASDSNNGKYATYQSGTNGPWKNYDKTRTATAAGDCVYVKAGTYSGVSRGDWGGDATNGYIQISAYPTEAPALTGSCNSRNNGGSKYQAWSKLSLSGTGTPFSYLDKAAPCVRICGNYFHDTSSSAGAGYIDIKNGDPCYIYGNYFYNINATSNLYHLVYPGSTDYDSANECQSITYFGWNEATETDASSSGGMFESRFLQGGPTTGDYKVYAFSNFFHDNRMEAFHFSTEGGNWPTSGKVYLYQNIIDTTAGSYGSFCIDKYSYSGATKDNIFLYNNTIYNTSRGSVVLGAYNYNTPSATLKNNIYYPSSGYTYIGYNVSQWVSDYDLFYNGGSIPAIATNYLNENPNFVDPAKNDFRLSASIPGTNAVSSILMITGVAGSDTTNSVVRDYYGNVRSVFDRGAAEYGTSTGEIPSPDGAISAPKGLTIMKSQ